MKFERRGKYPGVKVHLDKEECEILLSCVQETHFGPVFSADQMELFAVLVKKLLKLSQSDPTLLHERTEEEITATLMKEYVESEKKIGAIKEGLDWKKIKVEVSK